MERTESMKRSPAAEKIGSRLRDLEKQMPGIDDLKDRLQDANHRVLRFIKDRPEVCLVGALATGFLIARLVRNRG